MLDEARKKIMSYIPFTNDYSSLRTPAYVTAETSRINARTAAVHQKVIDGNKVMGDLITECCDDPAYGGQSYFDDTSAAIASLVPGTPASTTAVAPMAGASAGSSPFSSGPSSGGPMTPSSIGDPNAGGYAFIPQALTPVDILTGTWGWPQRANGRPWPRPRMADKYRRDRAAAYPNYGPMFEASQLVPPCPCFSSAPPVTIAVPVVNAGYVPPPAPVAAAPCPYPKCSTGNVCLDLVNGCVLDSQVDQAQQTACALANYGVFGNRGTWLGAIIHDCPNPPFLGTPLPNPPQADPSMTALLNSKGLSGFGQVDMSGGGGLLAVLAMFGIVVWAIRK